MHFIYFSPLTEWRACSLAPIGWQTLTCDTQFFRLKIKNLTGDLTWNNFLHTQVKLKGRKSQRSKSTAIDAVKIESIQKTACLRKKQIDASNLRSFNLLKFLFSTERRQCLLLWQTKAGRKRWRMGMNYIQNIACLSR